MEGSDPFDSTTECVDFVYVPLESYPRVEIEIINASDEPILVSNRTTGCLSPRRYFVATGTLGDRPLVSVDNYCSTEWPTCREWILGRGGCPLCDTLHPDLFLWPGGSRTMTWDAVALTWVDLPLECQFAVEEPEPVECAVELPFPYGNYELSARASTVYGCQGDCACEADARGACESELPQAIAFDRVATTTWYRDCDRVVLTFE